MGGILHNHRSSEVSLTLNIVRNESRSGHHHTFAEHHSEASHTNNNSGYALSGGSRSSRSLNLLSLRRALTAFNLFNTMSSGSSGSRRYNPMMSLLKSLRKATNNSNYGYNNSNIAGENMGRYGLSNALKNILGSNAYSLHNNSSYDYGNGNNGCNTASNTYNPNTAQLTLSFNRNSPVTPAGFKPSCDGKTAALKYGGNSIAFNQSDQSVEVTNDKTGKKFTVSGDPHEKTIDPRTGVTQVKDFYGNKTYKLPDGTQMTLVTGKMPGATSANAPTTVQAASFIKKGLDPVSVDNISAQNKGGLIAANTDRQVAHATKKSAVSMSTISENGELIV